MAIRRPPTTFSDTISTTDIADDAISGDKLSNDIAISTTGNIATTGSGTLTVAGASNFGSVASGTIGSSVVFPAGTIIQVVGKTLKNTDVTHTATFSDWEAITGFEVDISPKQINSDFLVSLTTAVCGEGSAEGHILLRRGYDSSGGTSFTETDIKGDASGDHTRSTHVHAYDFVESSSGSPHAGRLITITTNVWDDGVSYVSGGKFRYKVYWRNTTNTTGDLFLNRAIGSAAERATGISSIIVQEIAGT